MLGSAVIGTYLIKQLPEKCFASSIIWPETSYELASIYEIFWTGFKKDPNSIKLVGHWIGYPKVKYRNIQTTCIQSTVVCYQEDSEEIRNYDVQNGLDTLLELVEKGIEIARKHNIKGCVPLDSMGVVDRYFLSQMRRQHEKLGIWPN